MPHLDYFQFDDNYKKNEAEWLEIQQEILGEKMFVKLLVEEEEERKNKEKALQMASDEEIDGEKSDGGNKMIIEDMTEADMISLRRTIYLIIMNSVDFEECAHKLLKQNIVGE